MLMILLKLKSFASVIFNFFNTKIGQAVGLILIACIGLWYINNRAYSKGYDSGISYQLQIQQEAVSKLLKEKEILQEQANKETVETVKVETKIVTVYKDKIKEVEKLVYKYQDCKMDDKDFTEYKEMLEAIK